MESDDDDSDPTAEDTSGAQTVELFGFLQEDQSHIQELIAGIRGVLKRKSITARQICGLGKLLQGLQRLPLPTSGVNITVSICSTGPSGSSYQSLLLSESMFEASSGGSDYSPNVGSDSYTTFNFLVEVGGYRENVSYTDIEDWVAFFIQSLSEEAQDFEVHDEEESMSVEWQEINTDKYWEQLETEY
jgi:hypothetical protein